MEFIPGNAQHIGSRSQQQDAFLFSDPTDAPFVEHGGLLALVTDGMGGMERGDEASQIAAATFLAAYLAKDPIENVPDALLRALHEANQRVCELSRDCAAEGRIGTTLTAAVFHRDALHWTSVGDSPLQLLREGELTQITAFHNYGRLLEETAAEDSASMEAAKSHPDREFLTSFLGLEPLTEIDRNLRPFPLQPGDRILLASDGLTNTLSAEEIAAELGGASQESCESLVKKVIGKNSPHQDNVTVVLVHVKDDASPRPAAPTVKNPKPIESPIRSEIPVKTDPQAPASVSTPGEPKVGREDSPPLPPQSPTGAVLPTAPPVKPGLQRPRRLVKRSFLLWLAVALLLLALGALSVWQATIRSEPVASEAGSSDEIRPGGFEPGTAPPVEKRFSEEEPDDGAQSPESQGRPPQ